MFYFIHIIEIHTNKGANSYNHKISKTVYCKINVMFNFHIQEEKG